MYFFFVLIFLFYSVSKHHSREEVLHDVTMSHPVSRIAHVHQDIYILTCWYESCILPDEICVDCSILVQYQKSLSVHMERMLHRVHSLFIIRQADFYETSLFERPIYIHAFFPRLFVFQYPFGSIIGTVFIHDVHCIFPFYTV